MNDPQEHIIQACKECDHGRDEHFNGRGKCVAKTKKAVRGTGLEKVVLCSCGRFRATKPRRGGKR